MVCIKLVGLTHSVEMSTVHLCGFRLLALQMYVHVHVLVCSAQADVSHAIAAY